MTPANFSAKPPAINTAWNGPLEVTAAYHGDPASRFNANGMQFSVNLDEFSDNLAHLLRTSLRESGVVIAAGGKNIQVEVVFLDFLFQGPCLVDYTVTLGKSEIFGLQSAGASSNFQTACRSALADSVSQIVNDPRTQAYMREN